MNENKYYALYSAGLYRFFDVNDAPDGSPLPIVDFNPGIKEQPGPEWDKIIDEYRYVGEDLETEEIKFRFWRLLNCYANESGFLSDGGRWGFYLMCRIQSAMKEKRRTEKESR